MSEIVMLEGHESRNVLAAVIEGRAPAIVSYLSKDKWHVTKVIMSRLLADRLYVEGCHSADKAHPLNIQVQQPVGVNFKHAYGKFVFDTSVVALEPSSNPETGGVIVLAVPVRIGVVQRRSYFRVNVPESLKVKVVLWHRLSSRKPGEPPHSYCEGRLVDISAGGAQVVMPLKIGPSGQPPKEEDFEFHRGQFVGARFTPKPFEMPVMFNAQVRNILPTADRQGLCLGLQIVGLEASDEGRQTLSHLASIVDHYYQLNQAEMAAGNQPRVQSETPAIAAAHDEQNSSSD
jgi:hypothetical protein